jgi:hypothetical protein
VSFKPVLVPDDYGDQPDHYDPALDTTEPETALDWIEDCRRRLAEASSRNPTRR